MGFGKVDVELFSVRSEQLHALSEHLDLLLVSDLETHCGLKLSGIFKINILMRGERNRL